MNFTQRTREIVLNNGGVHRADSVETGFPASSSGVTYLRVGERSDVTLGLADGQQVWFISIFLRIVTHVLRSGDSGSITSVFSSRVCSLFTSPAPTPFIVPVISILCFSFHFPLTAYSDLCAVVERFVTRIVALQGANPYYTTPLAVDPADAAEINEFEISLVSLVQEKVEIQSGSSFRRDWNLDRVFLLLFLSY